MLFRMTIDTILAESHKTKKDFTEGHHDTAADDDGATADTGNNEREEGNNSSLSITSKPTMKTKKGYGSIENNYKIENTIGNENGKETRPNNNSTGT